MCNILVLINNRIVQGLLVIFSIMSFSSCEKFVEVDLPKSRINADLVFSNDQTAISAMMGVYVDLFTNGSGFASGNSTSITTLSGLSADELNHYIGIPEFTQFELNELRADNSMVGTLWASMYKTIYAVNAMIEGVALSDGMTAPNKIQLTGEAKFLRAFSYFYLTNLYGNVPLLLTTDYEVNAKAARNTQAEIYTQVKKDLNEAIVALGDDYVSAGRVRPNKSAAKALLARVHLFLNEWADAETNCTAIIDRNTQYMLASLSDVFLSGSSEAIWQLLPVIPGYNTNEGRTFIIESYVQNNVLNPALLNVFETGDLRLSNWINSFGSPTGIVYFPFKYKIAAANDVSEYSVVLRLAEVYLIRAEARARQNNISGAQDDINMIRERAFGMPAPTPANDGNALLVAIENERQRELFTEWGHRWFDLKRWNRTNDVLAPIKPSWNPEDVLYPIPQEEINKNPNLKPQNAGY